MMLKKNILKNTPMKISFFLVIAIIIALIFHDKIDSITINVEMIGISGTGILIAILTTFIILVWAYYLIEKVELEKEKQTNKKKREKILDKRLESKEKEKKLEEEKQKNSIFYRSFASKYLLQGYPNEILKHYKNPKEFRAENIKLESKVNKFRKQLDDFNYTENDYQLLKEIIQMYHDCHFKMYHLKKEYNGKVPDKAPIELFWIIKPVYEKINKKIQDCEKGIIEPSSKLDKKH